jgi:hypothetical protein
MVWPFNNNQPAQQPTVGAMNLGLPGQQQQVPVTNMGMPSQPMNQWGQPQPAPPTEMEIIGALINSNPMIDRWVATESNFTNLISLLSSIVAVSVHQMLANCTIKEDGDVMKFDFSAVQGMPTGDSIMMNMTQLQNTASNTVQQQQMQMQQMMAMANQGMMQGMLNDAMADPGMLNAAGQASGSFLRSIITGGR